MPPNIELLDHRVTELEEDHEELKDVLKELTFAINKLVIVDERQVNAALALDRLAGELHETRSDLKELAKKTEESIKRIGERIGALENAMPQQRQASQWVYDGVKALAVVACLVVLKKAGLM